MKILILTDKEASLIHVQSVVERYCGLQRAADLDADSDDFEKIARDDSVWAAIQKKLVWPKKVTS